MALEKYLKSLELAVKKVPDKQKPEIISSGEISPVESSISSDKSHGEFKLLLFELIKVYIHIFIIDQLRIFDAQDLLPVDFEEKIEETKIKTPKSANIHLFELNLKGDNFR